MSLLVYSLLSLQSPSNLLGATEMLLKVVIFTQAPVPGLIWSTPPDLWGQISFSAHHVGDDPIKLLRPLEGLPSRAQDLLVTVVTLMKSLTCNSIHLFSSKPSLEALAQVGSPVPSPQEEEFLTTSSDMSCFP
ncbi:hypothetical protein DSO57_1036710 [Entomophthora muscae]|uniref:Uncharacterized protein n=1 Tax=Entomophthora muscae TaxID=34485 RepID=A0ACC2TA06_9FUNG|nr:hypothetical protein DSO57_1036710 [Entomophthora muscae]